MGPLGRRLSVHLVVALLLTTAGGPASSSMTVDESPASSAVNVGMVQHQDEADRARQRKTKALGVLRSIAPKRRSDRQHRRRAIEDLTASIESHRDANRVSATSLQHARLSLVAIARLEEANESAARTAQSLVVSAVRMTADTAIADARLANRRFGGELETPIERARINRVIDRAERSRERGRSQLAGAGDQPEAADLRWAAKRYQQAWRRAQRALDVLHREVGPSVSIKTRTDPAWNGSSFRTRTIRGNITAVRPNEIDPLEVRVGGTLVTTTAVEAPSAPARNGSFSVQLDLASPPVVVEVAVPKGPRPPAGVRGGIDRSPPTNERRGRPSGERYRDVVRFDGDGLNDTYEVQVVGTDPMDPDSDAPVTTDNEADNGVPDGGEDFDGDRLITFAEEDVGTDPFVADSDGDGLDDRFEASLPALDPTASDTDGDGRRDGLEDFDGDGLAAAWEVRNQTSIASPDTDNDGLEDPVEIRIHGTAPLRRDTDGDGLEDGEEIDLGTDPHRVDTDRDGLRDGEERFETATTDPETGVSVVATGRGDVASGISVEPIAQPAPLEVTSGPVVRIDNRTSFEQATVTLPILTDGGTDGANLSVYKWSPGSDRPWHPVDSIVDPDRRTVNASVASFSYFTIIDEQRWREVTSDTVVLGWPRYEGFDDLTGWSVEGNARVEDGRLVLSSSGGTTVVVSQGGGGDFRRIQPAVDAAGPGDSIVVKPGTYREEVSLDRSVRLIGEDATLAGSGSGGDGAAIRVANDTAVTVAGLHISGYERGIDGAWTNTDVRLADLVITDTEFPIMAEAATGDWMLSGVVANDARSYSISGEETTGDWHISSVDFRDGGIRAYSSTGDWTVSNAAIVSRYAGVDVWESTGDWRVLRTRLTARGAGIDASGARGSFTLTEVVASGNDDGIDAFRSSGNWTINGADLRKNEEFGLYAGYSTGTWTLRNANTSENEWGIGAAHTRGDWRLAGVASAGNEREGIDAYGASGDWHVTDVVATGNEEWHGIDGYGTSGDWSVSNVDVSYNGLDGLAPTLATGVWQVTDARILGNAGSGVDGAGASGDISIRRSAVHGNGVTDVDGRRTTHPIRTEEVWWGQPGGPIDGQVVGGVSVGDPCADGSCAPGSVPVSPFHEPVRAESGEVLADVTPRTGQGVARVRRDVPLPGTQTNLTVTAKLAKNSDEDSVRLRLGKHVETSPEPGIRSIRASVATTSEDSISIEIAAEAGTKVAVDWIEIAFDSDGDGLRDLVERAQLGLPFGPVPGSPLSDLDAVDSDTDGDGLVDGAELTAVTVTQVPDQTSGTFVIWPANATADPTSRNSDGGGLTDGEERAAGSDPFVLETLVAGYTIPTMTDGDTSTIEDGNPMTIGEVDGIQFGGGDGSNLIAWPSRQFFDPAFCIKELTAGPGCSPRWMRGVDIQDDRHYVHVPFLVYANSNVELRGVPFALSFSSTAFVRPVKRVNATGSFGPRNVHRGYVVYELPDDRTGVELYAAGLRPIGEIKLEVRLEQTMFARETGASVTNPYSVSTSTMLPRMEHVLEDTRFVLSQGMTIATAAETGYGVAIRTGSSTRGALAFIYEFLLGQIETPPKTLEGLAEKAADEGIASFQERIEVAESDIHQQVFGNGTVRPVGPAIIRRN